jgi:predicted RNA-binding Zn-ribbon protein involved in translation (DUF1610 family)
MQILREGDGTRRTNTFNCPKCGILEQIIISIVLSM